MLTWRRFSGLLFTAWLAIAGCGSDELNPPGKPTDDAAAGESPITGPEAVAGAGGVGTDLDAAESGASAPLGGGSSTSSAGSGGAAGTMPITDEGGAPVEGGPTTPAPGSVTLGGPCDAPSECLAGLTCVTGSSDLLDDGRSLPNGSCTRVCAGNSDCTAYGADALCYPFRDGAQQGYCIEGCAFGDPARGEPAKCHNRADFSCLPALLLASSDTCQDTSDCLAGEICNAGTCALTVPACLPACRGDLDCASGSYCDQSFLSGTCTTTKPTGKPLGAPCTVPGAGEPLEPDECLGFCQSDGAGSEGHCSTTCGLANGCAWDTKQQHFDGACLYLSTLNADVAGAGDFGFCTPTCNCSAECQDEALECSELPQGPLSADFKGPGLCFAKSQDSSPIEQCP